MILTWACRVTSITNNAMVGGTMQRKAGPSRKAEGFVGYFDVFRVTDCEDKSLEMRNEISRHSTSSSSIIWSTGRCWKYKSRSGIMHPNDPIQPVRFIGTETGGFNCCTDLSISFYLSAEGVPYPFQPLHVSELNEIAARKLTGSGLCNEAGMDKLWVIAKDISGINDDEMT